MVGLVSGEEEEGKRMWRACIRRDVVDLDVG